jgi:hypothetical protein
MRAHIYIAVLAVGTATAASFGKHKPAGVRKVLHKEDQSHLLVRRDGYCSGSCSSCFGAGNIICQGILCYNPSAGEQCCGDGSELAIQDDKQEQKV